jgi:sugar phosphate isomerase/epimerase
MDVNLELIDLGNAIGEKYGVKVLHETHRGRFLYSAPASLAFFKTSKDLKICADFSHWVCVSESLLEDQEEVVQHGIQRAHHIHGRVGHAQGPQINDPRAPEWKAEVDTFTSWWQRIIDRAVADNLPYFTITPEFGPLPYMWSKPYSQEPLGDQWEINCYMKDYLKKILTY